MKKQTIIKGTLILTIAGLISRFLGFAIRIYLSNLIGAEGMGLYQLVFPIYMVCYTVCCSGLFTAISRLTAEEYAKGSKSNAKKILFMATGFSLTLSIILMFLLYFFADLISIKLINEPRIAMGIKIVSVSIPFTAIINCIKGYFYGINRPKLPAVSQIFEQIVRISVIFGLFSYFVPKGLAYACAMAVIGMTVGEIASCILLFSYYKYDSRNIFIKKANKTYTYFIKKISSIAVPLTSNRLITTLLVSIETILIPTKLQAHGYSHSYAISIYGTLTGMALPLILFPTVVTTAASLMLLPAISEAHTRNQKSVINRTVSKTIKFTLLMGIIFTFFFLSFGKSLGTIIYNEEYVGTLLVILCWLCPFLYLQTTLGSILNGLDKHMITLRNSIIAIVIRIIFIYIFIPILGLEGYLLGLIASLIIVSILHLYHLIRTTSISFNVFNFIVKPVICCVASLSALDIIQYLYPFPFSQTINILISTLIFFILLLPLLYLTNCISIKEFGTSPRLILARHKK